MSFKDPYDKGLVRAWHFRAMEPRGRSLGSLGHLGYAPEGDCGTSPFLPLSLPSHDLSNFTPSTLPP